MLRHASLSLSRPSLFKGSPSAQCGNHPWLWCSLSCSFLYCLVVESIMTPLPLFACPVCIFPPLEMHSVSSFCSRICCILCFCCGRRICLSPLCCCCIYAVPVGRCDNSWLECPRFANMWVCDLWICKFPSRFLTTSPLRQSWTRRSQIHRSQILIRSVSKVTICETTHRL